MSLLIKCNQHWFPQSAYEEGVEEIAEPYTAEWQKGCDGTLII